MWLNSMRDLEKDLELCEQMPGDDWYAHATDDKCCACAQYVSTVPGLFRHDGRRGLEEGGNRQVNPCLLYTSHRRKRILPRSGLFLRRNQPGLYVLKNVLPAQHPRRPNGPCRGCFLFTRLRGTPPRKPNTVHPRPCPPVAPEIHRAELTRPRNSRTMSLRRPELVYSPDIHVAIRCGAPAVSYTHLDVYKRQLLRFGGRFSARQCRSECHPELRRHGAIHGQPAGFVQLHSG